MMQLFFASTSAYVRKVMVCANVLGLSGEIERLDSAAHPVVRDERIALFNPLAKVPALRTEEGSVSMTAGSFVNTSTRVRRAIYTRKTQMRAGEVWHGRRWATALSMPHYWRATSSQHARPRNSGRAGPTRN
jgi:hypothetical protein